MGENPYCLVALVTTIIILYEKKKALLHVDLPQKCVGKFIFASACGNSDQFTMGKYNNQSRRQ